MAKKPTVLGNDPFRRGAAERRPAGHPSVAQGSMNADESREAPEAGGARGGAKKAAGSEAPKAARASAAEGPAKAPPKVNRPARRGASEKKQAAARPSAAEGPAKAQPQESRPARRGAREKKQAAPPAPTARPSVAPAELTSPPTTSTKEPAAAEGKTGAEVHLPSTLPAPRPSEVPLFTGGGREPTGLEALHAGVVALRRMLHVPSETSAEVDEFGKEPGFEEKVRPLLEWMYARWFRVDAAGFGDLPRDVPVILVANRAGAIPWDSLMLSLAARRGGRELRPLVEDSIFHFPSMGLVINRLGAVRACPENGERILAENGAVAVFPEGATGFGKPFRERYRLRRFGRGGFVKLALRTGALVVPVAIVGSEEIHPLLTRLDLRPFGFPFLPITPTFPWLGPAGLVPLPSKWRIEAGKAFDFRGHGPAAANDEPLVLRLAEEVRGTVQGMLDRILAERESAFR